MWLASSTTKPLPSLSLSRSTNYLKRGIARRTFIKTLIGLAIVGAESEFVACSSKNIFTSSVPAGVELFTYKGHTDFVYAAEWSPQSQYIASGGADQTVQVWNAVNGTLQSTYHQHDSVTAIAWSPDGNYVASGGDNKTVYVWDTTSPAEKLVSTYNAAGHIWGLEWSPDGKFIAVGVGSNQHSVMIYDTSTETLRLICDTGTADVWNVAWSPDSKYIAVACQDTSAVCTYNAVAPCQDDTIQVFDVVEDGHNKLTFHLHKGNVWGVDWSPDGRYIASGGFDNKIFVWEAKDGSVVFSGEHSDIVYGVAWSPDGTYVTSASRDGLVKVWDGTGNNVVNYSGLSGSVFRSSWSPEGKRIVSAYRDATVQVWKLPI